MSSLSIGPFDRVIVREATLAAKPASRIIDAGLAYRMALDAPGFFGKVPARGDFLTRRLPPGVATSWDDWLGMLTSAVREAAGEAWPEAWLTAPLWHFTLGPALAPATGVTGVLIASADRVGRLFPFTVLGPSAGVPDQSWSGEVETLALAALEDDFDPDALDDALSRLGPPSEGAPLGPGQSFWWCRGSDRVQPTQRLVDGWPGRAAAIAMVLGGPEDPDADNPV